MNELEKGFTYAVLLAVLIIIVQLAVMKIIDVLEPPEWKQLKNRHQMHNPVIRPDDEEEDKYIFNNLQ